MMKLTKIILLTFLIFQGLSLRADKLAHLRTSRKIVTVTAIQAPFYTIQIVALQLPPSDANFFNEVTNVREFICTDGYVRYTVGEYQTFTEAARDLNRYREMGYKDAFVLNTRKITLKDSEYNPSGSKNDFIPLRQVLIIQCKLLHFDSLFMYRILRNLTQVLSII
jgi:hypothetical protein